MRWTARARLTLARWRRPRRLGERGERAAERYLRRLGYVIVARSRRDRLGEIDLVAVDGRTIVFVEVKTRRSHEAGHPVEAVDEEKQRRLTRLALAYLKHHDLMSCSARFDVIAVTWPDGARRPVIEHFKNAFEAADPGRFSS
ncbi:MAG: YraN family protein [Planctomycetes bacterium]|nr:YraN family protein [Planctomycetota bacterium]